MWPLSSSSFASIRLSGAARVAEAAAARAREPIDWITRLLEFEFRPTAGAHTHRDTSHNSIEFNPADLSSLPYLPRLAAGWSQQTYPKALLRLLLLLLDNRRCGLVERKAAKETTRRRRRRRLIEAVKLLLLGECQFARIKLGQDAHISRNNQPNRTGCSRVRRIAPRRVGSEGAWPDRGWACQR